MGAGVGHPGYELVAFHDQIFNCALPVGKGVQEHGDGLLQPGQPRRLAWRGGMVDDIVGDVLVQCSQVLVDPDLLDVRAVAGFEIIVLHGVYSFRTCRRPCCYGSIGRRRKGDILVQPNGTAAPASDAPDAGSPVPDSFGALLKDLRRQAHLTQAELAGAVGYSREQITKLEHGQRLPELSTVRALFVPALGLETHSDLAARLLRLAAAAHGPKVDPTGAAPPTYRSAPRRTNVPPALTSFVGRIPEVAALKRQVAATRLLTLTGTGGVGKTRLALNVAAELLDAFPDGVWLVELAPITDPLLVPRAVAVALGLSTAGARPIDQQLVEFVRTKQLLLVLDNCEHQLVACARLAEDLLRAAPQLHILATSRELLGVLSAVAWQVPSLTLPPAPTEHAALTVEEALRAEAVQLFVARARASQPGWSLLPTNVAEVVDICRRLDGVPLAIELAATRVRALAVRQIAERLDDRFRLLGGGNRTALPRHQTLRALVDWSYELLSTQEQALLRQLAVFVGGWTLEAAEWVAGPAALELLAQLVDKSLVQLDDRGRTVRYHLLETIGQYGRDKLVEAGEAAIGHGRHLAWCQRLVRQASPYVSAPSETPWYEVLEREHDNVHAALGWAVRHDPQAAVELIAGLYQYWFLRGYWREGTDVGRARVCSGRDIADSGRRSRARRCGQCCRARRRLRAV